MPCPIPLGEVMRRRDFILAGGATVAWSLAARAQQPAIPLIGFLSSRSLNDSRHLVDAFRAGLQASGYIEAQNVAVEYRWAEGQYDRLPALAAELVRSRVAVLVTTGGEPSVLAAKAATSSIPIVFTTGGDPVKMGLVASLSRPGGNATGASLLTTAPEAKRLGILHELAPRAGVVGVLIDPNYQQAEDQAREVQEAAKALNLQIEIAHAGKDQELESAFAALVRSHAAALLVTADPFFDTRRDHIIALAAQFRLPAIYQFRDYAVAGGLVSYGVSLADGYRQVGVYAGRVLKGDKPGDLPIYQAIKFEFVINLKTAQALDLQVPPMLSALADEVIE
jgi:putative tryptophan/tyrosine transport system substrate-binding protein